MTEYNLHWRTLTITKVDWEWQEICFKWDDFIDEDKFPFTYPENHNSDIQCLKMIVDRYVVSLFKDYVCGTNGYYYLATKMLRYIVDIFEHPYEWNTVLLE